MLNNHDRQPLEALFDEAPTSISGRGQLRTERRSYSSGKPVAAVLRSQSPPKLARVIKESAEIASKCFAPNQITVFTAQCVMMRYTHLCNTGANLYTQRMACIPGTILIITAVCNRTNTALLH